MQDTSRTRFGATCLIAVTGDIFAKANNTMKGHSDANVWRYTSGAKAAIIALGFIIILSFVVSVR